jgi:hypothetical protein
MEEGTLVRPSPFGGFFVPEHKPTADRIGTEEIGIQKIVEDFSRKGLAFSRGYVISILAYETYVSPPPPHRLLSRLRPLLGSSRVD